MERLGGVRLELGMGCGMKGRMRHGNGHRMSHSLSFGMGSGMEPAMGAGLRNGMASGLSSLCIIAILALIRIHRVGTESGPGRLS